VPPSLHLSTANGLSICEVQLVQCDYQLHGMSPAAAVGSSHCMVHHMPLVLCRLPGLEVERCCKQIYLLHSLQFLCIHWKLFPETQHLQAIQSLGHPLGSRWRETPPGIKSPLPRATNPHVAIRHNRLLVALLPADQQETEQHIHSSD